MPEEPEVSEPIGILTAEELQQVVATLVTSPAFVKTSAGSSEDTKARMTGWKCRPLEKITAIDRANNPSAIR